MKLQNVYIKIQIKRFIESYRLFTYGVSVNYSNKLEFNRYMYVEHTVEAWVLDTYKKYFFNLPWSSQLCDSNDYL